MQTSTFELAGELYSIHFVNHSRCIGCVFDFRDCEHFGTDIPNCSTSNRDDGKEVIFKKVGILAAN